MINKKLLSNCCLIALFIFPLTYTYIEGITIKNMAFFLSIGIYVFLMHLCNFDGDYHVTCYSCIFVTFLLLFALIIYLVQ